MHRIFQSFIDRLSASIDEIDLRDAMSQVSQGAELCDGFISAATAEASAENEAWYCWHASRRQAMLEAWRERAGAFAHRQIIWVKDRGVLIRSHYLWKHEPCFMGWLLGKRPPKVSDETLP